MDCVKHTTFQLYEHRSSVGVILLSIKNQFRRFDSHHPRFFFHFRLFCIGTSTLLSERTILYKMCVLPNAKSLVSLTFGVRSYLNKSQLLPILGSKAKYARENAAVGTSYIPLAVFRGVCTPDTASTRSILRFCTLLHILLRILSGSHQFGALVTAAVVDTPCCASISRGSVPRVCEYYSSLSVFRLLVSVRITGFRYVSTRSTYRNTPNMSSTLRV